MTRLVVLLGRLGMGERVAGGAVESATRTVLAPPTVLAVALLGELDRVVVLAAATLGEDVVK